jgi:hypothetical protein
VSPLHTIAVAPVPQTIVQPAPAQVHAAEPPQLTVQAPVQVTAHAESPPQLAVDPSPSVSVQVEPPAQVALLAEPTDWAHIDCPSQVEVQPVPQVPVQLVLEAQWEMQSLPQSTMQVFMCWQSKVAPVGRSPLLLPPSLPPAPPPSVQVPPAAQVQVVSVQAQAPVHWPCSALLRVQPGATTASAVARRIVRMWFLLRYWMRPKQVQSISPAAQEAPVGPEQLPAQHGCVVEHDCPTYEQLVPMSPGGAPAPHVPLVWPGGTLHKRPAQQSPSLVHFPVVFEQPVPQRRTPPLSGRQGAPLQHSAENVHCWPTAIQQPGVPS